MNSNITPFSFHRPQSYSAPILVSCPHAGKIYPISFIKASAQSEFTLRSSEDVYVDDLCEGVPELGLGFIKTNIARSFIDLNRAPDSLDPQIIEGVVSTNCDNAKAGFGVIARLVGQGSIIYKRKLSLQEAIERINNFHKPYHNAIFQELNAIKTKFGRAMIIDMHSMPNISLGNLKADIIIGDRYSKSCNSAICDMIEDYFSNCGLKVRRNHPFAGGFTTKEYGKPQNKIEALQIEINRGLYVNEASLEKLRRFDEIKGIITDLFKLLIREQ